MIYCFWIMKGYIKKLGFQVREKNFYQDPYSSDYDYIVFFGGENKELIFVRAVFLFRLFHLPEEPNILIKEVDITALVQL